MLEAIINRLRGQVCVRVESRFPERILNLCSARGVLFWSLKWESESVFTFRMGREAWRTLRRAGAELDCDMQVVRREGAPYFLLRFRRRHVLTTGLAVCALWLMLGSLFVWDFQVEGNRTVSTERILRAVSHYGVGLGSFGLGIDGEDLRNHVLLEIPELSWISLNVSGYCANIQVRERVMPPTPVDERTPTNVVARRAGLVRQLRPLDGVRMVVNDTMVEQGQLLISGVEDTGTFGARLLSGRGSAMARTWYRLETTLPLEIKEKHYTGEEVRAAALVVGTRRINLFGNSGISGEKYDKITTRHPWSLLGISLPVTWVTETRKLYETVAVQRDAPQVQAQGEAILTEYLHSIVDPYGTVTSTLCSAKVRGNVLEVTLSAECEEEIGQSVEIYTQEAE